MRLPLFDQLPLFRSAPPPPVKAGERIRRIQLGNRIVSYTLRQAARRRLALSIDERGLRVGAPKSITLQQIENFIHDNSQWVLNKLDEYASRAPRQLTICDGQRLPLLGAEVNLRVITGANRSHWEDETLVIEARANADLATLSKLTRRALQRKAHALFLQRIAHYGHGISRAIPPLSPAGPGDALADRAVVRSDWPLGHGNRCQGAPGASAATLRQTDHGWCLDPQAGALAKTYAQQVATLAIFVAHQCHLRQVGIKGQLRGVLDEIRNAEQHAQRQVDQVFTQGLWPDRPAHPPTAAPRAAAAVRDPWS